MSFSSSLPVFKLPKALQCGLCSLELLNIFLWDTVLQLLALPRSFASALWQAFLWGALCFRGPSTQH